MITVITAVSSELGAGLLGVEQLGVSRVVPKFAGGTTGVSVIAERVGQTTQASKAGESTVSQPKLGIFEVHP